VNISPQEAQAIVELICIAFSEGLGPDGMWRLLKRLEVEAGVTVPRHLVGYMERGLNDGQVR
jgi:hypothetical protein